MRAMYVLRRAYDAFNARDIEAALALMHDDVDWPNGMEGGREPAATRCGPTGRASSRMIDSHVEPVAASAEAADGRVAVAVRQTVRDLDGKVLSEGLVTHVYTLRDGLVARMDIVSRM